MKWEKMQEPLERGFQVFRVEWPEDQYMMREEEGVLLFSGEHPEGVEVSGSLSDEDLTADDWATTGPSGG